MFSPVVILLSLYCFFVFLFCKNVLHFLKNKPSKPLNTNHNKHPQKKKKETNICIAKKKQKKSKKKDWQDIKCLLPDRSVCGGDSNPEMLFCCFHNSYPKISHSSNNTAGRYVFAIQMCVYGCVLCVSVCALCVVVLCVCFVYDPFFFKIFL